METKEAVLVFCGLHVYFVKDYTDASVRYTTKDIVQFLVDNWNICRIRHTSVAGGLSILN